MPMPVQGQTPPTEYVMPTNGLNQYSGTTDPDEAFVYDYDGNLTVDGDFQYTWDAENRLIKVEAATVVKVEFTYDYMSRRVRKVSYEWQSGNWVQQTDQKFVYDGWNPVLELASGAELPSSTARTWGLDLSQTLQGAGGVGGLLATHLSNQVNAFVYDGNGNVSEALRVSNGTVEAHYEYDPFGNTTAWSGTWADANPFRFSTKWLDVETSLYYYGLRYYTPRLGRWLSRDPIEEEGGENLYGFAGNDGVNDCDSLGLLFGFGKPSWQTCPKGQVWTFKEIAHIPKADGCSNPFKGWILGTAGKGIAKIFPGISDYSGNPDAPWKGVSFLDACNFHDYCYSDCTKSKSDCDKGLHDRAKKACADAAAATTFPNPKAKEKWIAKCNAWADAYYTAVKTAASGAYEDRQKAACACTSCFFLQYEISPRPAACIDENNKDYPKDSCPPCKAYEAK